MFIVVLLFFSESLSCFFAGRLTLSWTSWTRRRSRWWPTSTLCAAICGRRSSRSPLLILAPTRRGRRPESELTTSSTLDVAHFFLLSIQTRSRCFGGKPDSCLLSADSSYLVLKKTDVESVFNIFQNQEENKTLICVSISPFLLPSFSFHCKTCPPCFSTDATRVPVEGVSA